jgi:hypothetical protein
MTKTLQQFLNVVFSANLTEGGIWGIKTLTACWEAEKQLSAIVAPCFFGLCFVAL